MSVPPLRLGSSFESYISGEVIIHESAVIAPGVILQAAPNSKIIVGAGVCIGMGSIIQVDRGTLEIEAGASLGAGFLMVGEGKIGSNACIGAATTVFRSSVASAQVIQPGSVLGYCDASRMPLRDVSRIPLRDRYNRHVEAIGDNQAEDQNQIPSNNLTTATGQPGQEVSDIGDINGDLWGLPDSQPTQSQTNNGSTASRLQFDPQSQFKSHFKSQSPSPSQSPASNNIPVENQNQPVAEDSTKPQTTTQPTEAAESSLNSKDTLGNHVYGQSSVQRLLVTLFPHRQSLNKPLPEDD
ncbi:MAG: transferase [Methylacidiphilales bacterium]|nr:transferase [Candidatus Methylacidiphilales bacterium]NJR14283.1 transferase [Calothrix sp. CSU_2_0]